MKDSKAAGNGSLVATGVPGFDEILDGGLTPNRLYLVEGDPGAGKTTLALQFLLEGVRRGEAGMYVTLSETSEELKGVARSHGWSLEGIELCELVPSEERLMPDAQSRMFHVTDVELAETTRLILDRVQKTNPRRVVFDSLSEMRLLSQNPLRYRRQVLALKQFFIGRECTVLLLDDRTSDTADLQLHSLAHGVISLEHVAHDYGGMRRRLRVIKLRGVDFRGGYHDFRICPGGLEIFPRLIAAEHRQQPSGDSLTSGIERLDSLLGGGLDRGSSTLLIGPAGTGKSTIATQFVIAATERGENAAIFAFDESESILRKRSAGLGLDLAPAVEKKLLTIQQIDPAELSPGEFVAAVREAVEVRSARIIVIDSLNGYLNAMPDERHLVLQLHELLTYLAHRGVVTFLLAAQHGLVGSTMRSPVDASYLADTVIMIRFFESIGRLRRSISVVKKRGGHHEDTLRELSTTSRGIVIGEPIRDFQGILTGVPTLVRQHGE